MTGTARKSILPPYFVWRDGRPRWVPGPGLRAQGFKGRNLTRPDGSWMTKGEAIEAADKLNACVRTGTPPPAPAAEKTLAALFCSYRESDNFRTLAPRTAVDYGRHMDLLAAWSGDVPAAAITRAAMRALYGRLRDTRGLATANAVLRTLRLVLNYAVNDLEWLEKNRACEIKMKAPPGRTVCWTPAEINTFCAAATFMGLHAQADAVLIAVCTGLNRADILTAPPFTLTPEGVFVLHRRKTGIVCNIPPTKPLIAQLNAMRARNMAAWPGIEFTTELVSSTTGRPYPAEGNAFARENRQVRLLAAGLVPASGPLPFDPCPSLAHKHFQDLRDTAATYLFAVTGGDIGRVANIMGWSLKNAQTIFDRHYNVRSARLARETGAGFERLLLDENIGGTAPGPALPLALCQRG